LRAAVVGLCAALVAVAFKWAIDGVAMCLNFVPDSVENKTLGNVLRILLCAACGLVAGYLTERVAPDAGGSGIPNVKAALLHLRELSFVRLLPAKFIGGVLAIGSGFSLGREGPTVHLGAAVADGVAKFLKVPFKSRSHLLACGAGAGLAAAFNAPLAGFLFVIEELRRELSPITYGATFIAAVIADGVTRFFLGAAPSLRLSIFDVPSLNVLPLVVLVGLGAGLAGLLFNRALLICLKRLPAKFTPAKRAMLVGLVIGCVTLISPLGTANLQQIINHFVGLESHTYPALILLEFLALKFILTLLSYLSGVPGGIFAPMLIQGALCGICVGKVATLFQPFEAVPDGIWGILGMASFFSASVRAPITGVVLIAEMTGNFDLLFPLLVASLVSYLAAELVGIKPIYEELMKLELRKSPDRKIYIDEPVIVDIPVGPHSRLDGIAVKDLHLNRGTLLIMVRRLGSEIVPHADFIITQSDELSFLVDSSGQEKLQELQSQALDPSRS